MIDTGWNGVHSPNRTSIRVFVDGRDQVSPDIGTTVIEHDPDCTAKILDCRLRRLSLAVGLRKSGAEAAYPVSPSKKQSCKTAVIFTDMSIRYEAENSRRCSCCPPGRCATIRANAYRVPPELHLKSGYRRYILPS